MMGRYWLMVFRAFPFCFVTPCNYLLESLKSEALSFQCASTVKVNLLKNTGNLAGD